MNFKGKTMNMRMDMDNHPRCFNALVEENIVFTMTLPEPDCGFSRKPPSLFFLTYLPFELLYILKVTSNASALVKGASHGETRQNVPTKLLTEHYVPLGFGTLFEQPLIEHVSLNFRLKNDNFTPLKPFE